MELIYCYMGVIGGKELNLEFPFSDKYEVSYDRDSKSVDIKECDEKIPSNFYGKNISNLNLIVGINGSWKSTLLNLIGSKVYDRRRLFSTNDQWFIVYHNKKDEFIFEGSDLQMIADFSHVQSLSNGYWVTADYNKKQKKLEEVKFIQQNEDGSLARRLSYLYQPTNSTRINRSKLTEDSSVSFERIYLYETNSLQEYSFLSEDYKNFSTSMNNIAYTINIKSSDQSFHKNRQELDLGLYNNNELTFKRSEIKKVGKRDLESNFTNKESFIIYFLEQQIVEVWNQKEQENSNALSGTITVNWSKNELNKIHSLTEKSHWNSFEDKKNYLLKILKELINVIVTSILGDEEQTSLYVEPYSAFLNSIKNINPKYFDTKRKLSFPISIQSVVDKRQFISLLETINKYQPLVNHLLIGVTELSDGQVNLIKQFSKIQTGFNKITSLNCLDNIVLLIDEPEIYLHPNWSRKFLSQLLKYINSLKTDYKIHVIITTHSPYLVSDTLGRSVIKIINDDDNIRVERNESGYALNYYNLIKDKFFMDSPIGEFAESKINNLITRINDEDYNDEHIKNEINLIGDKVIKDNLLIMLKNKKFEKEINDEYIKNLNSEIDMLKKEIQDLKNDN